MSEELKNIYKKITNLSKMNVDGKEHNSIITGKEAIALKNYIDKTRMQLKATETAAIEWEQKYKEATGKLDIDYIDNLKE